MADTNVLIAAGIGFGLWYAREQGLFGAPPAAERTTTPGSPAGASAAQPGSRTADKLPSGFVRTAATGVTTGRDRALKYHSLRIEQNPDTGAFEIYMRLMVARKTRLENKAAQALASSVVKEVRVPNPPPQYLQRKIQQALIARMERLPEDVKCEGAKKLNEYTKQVAGTDPGITCDDSVAEAVGKAAPALGAAGGAAACAATGVGAALTPLCGMAGAAIGAWIGDKVGPWLEGALEDVGEFFEDAWDKIKFW